MSAMGRRGAFDFESMSARGRRGTFDFKSRSARGRRGTFDFESRSARGRRAFELVLMFQKDDLDAENNCRKRIGGFDKVGYFGGS